MGRVRTQVEDVHVRAGRRSRLPGLRARMTVHFSDLEVLDLSGVYDLSGVCA